MEEIKTSKIVEILKKVWGGIKKGYQYLFTEDFNFNIWFSAFLIVAYIIGMPASTEVYTLFVFGILIYSIMLKLKNK